METQILRKLHKKTLKNFMDILIMKILREDSPKSGYELMTFFHEKYDLLMSSGTVYSRLYSMERDGLIKGEWDNRQRVYELTEKSRKTINFILKSSQINLQFMTEILGSTFSDSLSLRENYLEAKAKTDRDFKIGVRVLLSRHHETFKKIHLLEAALLSLLKEIPLEDLAKEGKLQGERLKVVKDFLKLYRRGVIHHFKIEEGVLFQELRNAHPDKELLIQEFLLEHKNIIEKYFQLKNTERLTQNPLRVLEELLKDLSDHATKEEKMLSPLVQSLSEEQLKRIDEKLANFGYDA
jgi:DNA-binding PadR family transcriptional regulator/hemerythrin superfamily protein